MKKQPILMFDLGGVLIENTTFENLNELMPQTQDREAIKQRWLTSPAVRDFERGQIGAEDFAARFITEWEIQISPEAFLLEFVSWSKGFHPDAREILGRLRRTHRIACLSNSNPLHWRKFGGYENEFDITLLSHRLGAIKPDREAFLLAIGACGVEAAEIYFFDDSPANILGAQSLGMRAFLTDGFDSLLNNLRSQRLLPPSRENPSLEA